ncbi:MAG TPA: sensor domain-containing diguanylate cyclase [Baekduia sp.]|nr:sensor domain-containing diguanylate cyclase [Baekduia sp.]
MSKPTPQPQTAALREALDAARAVRTRDDLTRTLDRIAAVIAATLRCRTVAVNLHRPSWDDFEVATVHGSDEARRALLGQASTWEQWAPYLSTRSARHGAQRTPADGVAAPAGAPVVYRPAADAADRWGPEDFLLGVMRRANGDILGIVSVDEPLDGARPGDADCERFAELAGVAALAAERAVDQERDVRHRGAVERLTEISGRAGAHRTRDGVLDAVCTSVREALGFGRVAALLAGNGGLLRPAATAGWTLDDPAFGHLALTLGQLEPLLQAVHERQGCYLVEHEEAETILGLDGDTIYRSQTNGHGPYAWQRHWLIAPLRDAAGDLRGVVWADDPSDWLLPGRDRLQLLRLFADQAASVLDAPAGLAGGGAGPVLGAEQDPLTGLATRTKLAERLRHALQRVKRTETTVAVLFIDLDNFQHANDTLGHAGGDELLRLSAARIDDDLRPGDTVARFGGDEFVVLCEDVGSADDAMEIAERLRALLAEPIPLATGVTQVTASIGVALPDRPDRSAEALLQAADRAMYEAKAAGRDAARLATPGAGWP